MTNKDIWNNWFKTIASMAIGLWIVGFFVNIPAMSGYQLGIYAGFAIGSFVGSLVVTMNIITNNKR